MGQRLRIGAYLWKRPDRGGGAGDDDLETALRRNLSQSEFQRAREFAIPELLERGGEAAWPVCGRAKEDLEWVEVDEKELSERLRGEEGNLREKDIDGIIEAEAKRTGEAEMLDSFKSFLNAISNVEGVDCVGTEGSHDGHQEEEKEKAEAEGESKGEAKGESEGEDVSLDFEKLCRVLKGQEPSEPAEPAEPSEPSERMEEEEDEEMLSNLLASLGLQEGGEGPMGSILASLGKR